ncbi:LPS export ABC transporter permease LptG [Azotobacter vinelandii]|uniref:LPS export ABC transporter permease LptG n=1 Tax=Azotobacter vinelandii TaxID=354 RepID=UPI0007734CDA|nr:LPS export ABC transporter permease LptG [Azotobacter vinelandii]
MGKLDRYIGASVSLSILAVLGVLVGLALLFSFVDELGDVQGDYDLAAAAWYVFLTVPQRTYEMLPMGALIGCLIGLGSLASSSELTVIRASGISLGRIVWAVMKPMLVLMVLGGLLGEYLAPWAENKAEAHRSLAQGGGEAQTSKHGLWHRQGNEFVHINAVQPGGVLYGVTRYRFDDQRHMLWSSFARKAEFRGGNWQLEDVTTTRFLERSTEVAKAATEQWDILLSPQLLGTVVMDPEALSVTGLWHYIHYLAEQELNNARYWLAFWGKVLQPLVTAALVLMAISFIFGPLRSVTLGQRLFTGVLAGFVFRMFQDLLGPSSQVFGFSPLLAVLLPAGLCALLGVYLLRRAG